MPATNASSASPTLAKTGCATRPSNPGRSPMGRSAREVRPVSLGERDVQADADAALGSLIDGLGPDEAALALAILANRAAARLHTLSRTAATERKAQPDWPAWAQLQNAARTMVLQASTCRDLAVRLIGRKQ